MAAYLISDITVRDRAAFEVYRTGAADAILINEGVPTPVLSCSIYARFASRGESEFQNKMPYAIRYASGGHHEKSAIAR